MADKFGLNGDVRELKIGKSFEKNASGYSSQQQQQSSAFHTVRYDFKPASVDPTREGVLHVDENASVFITVPHMHGNGHTKFSGRVKNANAKECILIIDRDTGEITIEALSSQLLVKKTRPEKPSADLPPSTSPTPSTMPTMSTAVSTNHSSRSQNQSKQPTNVKQSQASKLSEPHQSSSPSSFILPTPLAADEAKKKSAGGSLSAGVATTKAGLSDSSSSSSSSSSDDSSGSSNSGSENEDEEKPKRGQAIAAAMSMPSFGLPSTSSTVAAGSNGSHHQQQPSMPSFGLTKPNGLSATSAPGRSPVLGRPAPLVAARQTPTVPPASMSMPQFLNEDLQLSESEDDSD